MKKFIIIFSLFYSFLIVCSQDTQSKDQQLFELAAVIAHSSVAVCLHPQQECDYTLECIEKPSRLSLKEGGHFTVITVLKNNTTDNFMTTQDYYEFVKEKDCSGILYEGSKRAQYTTPYPILPSNGTYKSETDRETLRRLFPKACAKFLKDIREVELTDHEGKSYHFQRTDLPDEQP